MARAKYAFAVAYIRAMEAYLLNDQAIDQLLATKTYEDALRLIKDRGWGDPDGSDDADSILTAERSKIWETMRSLNVPMETFGVLSYPNEFHNLKTAIKEAYKGERHDDYYFEGTEPSMEELRQIIDAKDYSKLPAYMDEAAKDAFETLLHTGDGQLCDIIIDHACMQAIDSVGRKSKDAVIKDYADTQLVIGNIKVAVRCAKTGKSVDFINRALCVCHALDAAALSKATTSGFEAICEFLASSGFAEAAEALRGSPSAFERWCDDYLIEMMQPQLHESFTIGPLVAYAVARENEIKTVGIILTAKRNGLDESRVRERVRKMYV